MPPPFPSPCCSSRPAQAQDAATVTGPRVEATIGLDQLRYDLGDYGGEGRGKANDLGYGVAAGYDVALSPALVGGVEVGVKLSDNDVAVGTATTGGAFRELRDVTIAGRLGVPIGSGGLVYGKVGYANLRLRQDLTAAGVTTSTKSDLDGLLLGAGVEATLTGRTYVKGEYRFTDYDKGYKANQVLTGVGVRF